MEKKKKQSGRGLQPRPSTVKMSNITVQPNKLRGQNFLNDASVIERIIELGRVEDQDVILEIGPGLGALTEPLSKLTQHLSAIEIEDDFALYLKAAFIENSGVEIIHDNALTFDFTGFNGKMPFSIFGNLPYSITTPLIKRLLTEGGAWRRMVLLLQKEAAVRIAYGKGRDNGVLSILAEYYGNCTVAFDVPGSCFTPSPAVTSAVLLIERRLHPPVTGDITQIARLAEAAFANRRKTLLNSLSASALGGDKLYWRNGLVACGFDENARAEALKLADYDTLLHWMEANKPGNLN